MNRWMTWSTYDSLNSTLFDIRESQFGSDAPRKIDHLRRELLLVARGCESQNIIIDLTQVQRYGAWFLGMLVGLAKCLRKSGKRLIVCGERFGLIHIFRLDQLIPSLPTVAQALDWKPENR
jgi:anti-anti-sigma regulatory factor